MAHENLKFKLDIRNNNDFQPILGSQDYGTFYMVYVKINNYENFTNSDGYEQHTYDCDFRIQNFIGDITIGFGDFFPNFSFASALDSNDPVHASFNITISPFNTNVLIKNRKIDLHRPIESGMIIKTQFRRSPPDINLYDPLNPNNSKYLNPYRFIRDGEDYIEISGRIFPDQSPFPEPDELGDPMGFCVPNRLIIS